MKGDLIYKSEKSKLEIYRTAENIVVYGVGKNEILRTFNLKRVCNEISYSNEQKNMFRFVGTLMIAGVIYEIYMYIFRNDYFNWQEFIGVAFLILISIITFLTNDGFSGWLKFQENQKESIKVSKVEFNSITNVLLNELKNEVSREISF